MVLVSEKAQAQNDLAEVDYYYHNDHLMTPMFMTDAAGNITSINDAFDTTWQRNFTYDALNQLTYAAAGPNWYGEQFYDYDAAGNRLAFEHGDVTETYKYGYQEGGATGSRLLEIDPPAKRRDIEYMTAKEFNAKYRIFKQDYRDTLQQLKIWANQTTGNGANPAAQLKLEDVLLDFAAFSTQYGLDPNWWYGQVGKDARVFDLFFEFLETLLINNDVRVGEKLTADERALVNELVPMMKSLDPTPPAEWIVTNGAMPMAAISGGGSVVTYFDYEPNGNITAMREYHDAVLNNTKSSVYDAANRVTGLSIDGLSVAAYTYNYMNQRVKKSALMPLASTWFVYDLAGNMIEEIGTGGEAEYVYLGGHRIAMIEPNNSITIPGCGSGVPSGGCTVAAHGKWETVAVNWILLISPGLFVLGFIYARNGKRLKGVAFVMLISSGIVITSYVFSSAQTDQFKIYYFLNDHLDTPQKIVDQLGAVSNETKLDPFGNVFNEYGNPATNFRFPGQYHDRESGMYYNWNRFYMASAGRYNRADPMGQINILPIFNIVLDEKINHLYGYANNNPMRYTDYKGLGIIDAIKCGYAQRAAATAMAQQTGEEFTQTQAGRGERNAFLHCVLACLLVSYCGTNYGSLALIQHEIFDPHQTMYDLKMDMYNNREGIDCSKGVDCNNKVANQVCTECCRTKSCNKTLSY